MFVGTLGCVTNNWASTPFGDTQDSSEKIDLKEAANSFWNSKFGELSGSDQRARDIEKRLGY